MKTTKTLFDEEHEYLREKGYISAEKYELESRLIEELWYEDQVARVILGKVRKKTKNQKNATVTTRKVPRIISLQFNHRGVLGGPYARNRLESSIHPGMPE